MSGTALLLCTALVRSTSLDGAVAAVLDGSRDRRQLAATDAVCTAGAELQFSVWEGPGPDAWSTGTPVVVPDLAAAADRWPVAARMSDTLGLGAVAAYPLLDRGRPIGLLGAYRRRCGPLTADDRRALARTADLLAAVVLADGTDPDLEDQPASSLSIAVGMVMARLELAQDDALAVLRGHAYAGERTLSELASDLVARRVGPGELDAPGGPRGRTGP